MLAGLLENGGGDGDRDSRIGGLIDEALDGLREPSPFAPLLYNQVLDLAALARSGAAGGYRLEQAAHGLGIIEAALARMRRLGEIARPA